MTASVLEHVNIRTTDLAATIAFWTHDIGLREGPRPSTRPGAWIYDERDVPVVHVAFYDPSDAAQRNHVDTYLGVRTLNGTSGCVDHVAFGARDYAGTATHLRTRGHDIRERVTDAGLPQIFVTDPNGIVVELNFNEERRA